MTYLVTSSSSHAPRQRDSTVSCLPLPRSSPLPIPPTSYLPRSFNEGSWLSSPSHSSPTPASPRPAETNPVDQLRHPLWTRSFPLPFRSLISPLATLSPVLDCYPSFHCHRFLACLGFISLPQRTPTFTPLPTRGPFLQLGTKYLPSTYCPCNVPSGIPTL